MLECKVVVQLPVVAHTVKVVRACEKCFLSNHVYLQYFNEEYIMEEMLFCIGYAMSFVQYHRAVAGIVEKV
jgi:hypothetical protein